MYCETNEKGISDAANKGNLYSSGFEGVNWKLATAKDIKLKIIQKVKMVKRICFEIKILRKQEAKILIFGVRKILTALNENIYSLPNFFLLFSFNLYLLITQDFIFYFLFP